MQQSENYAGIPGINAQDRAIQESMGAIVDRSREHLGPADRAVIVMRRQLLQAARGVQEGANPPGTGESYHRVRAIERVLPAGRAWREALLSEMYPEGDPHPNPLPLGEGKYERRAAQAPPPAQVVEVMR